MLLHKQSTIGSKEFQNKFDIYNKITMAIIVRKQGQRHQMPPGHYFKQGNIEYLVTFVTMNSSGNICISGENPNTFDKTILTVCSVEDLISTVNLEYIKR